MGLLNGIRHWLRRAEDEAATATPGGKPIATPPKDSFGQPARETSTNAQTQGASDEPWSSKGDRRS